MEYEHGAENQPMDGNPSMRGPSKSATHIARADCPHLSDPVWEALQRLATVIGEAASRGSEVLLPLRLRRRSCLGGRARSWAYGRRLTDTEFKEELRQAFEPPKNEFRSRAEFLDLQQGKHDVHAYAQRARYLVANIVTNPMDEATKVVTFMKGLRDGPVKTYLFREHPSTLEAAITLAMQEEFSLR
ncbi:hypothetical protein PI124_g17235 [Phytophthora idaei]|nr:hypothetical protein PI124_g17235 [Phytophthora idaei]